jgi:hypothetical protein
MQPAHTFPKAVAGLAALCCILFFTQCSSDNTSNNDDTMRTDRYVSEVHTAPGTDAATGDGTVNTSTTTAGQSGTNTGTAVEHGHATVVVLPPAKERMMVTNDMRGLRGLLMADLEEVRSRLNDGARPAAEREIDKALAADLAQGLERVDRALAALGTVDDATWATMRETRLKEVEEVRAWMADYRLKETWARK